MAESPKFDPQAMTIGDLRELKKLTREQLQLTWKETMEGLETGDPDVVALSVYIAERRRDPSITPESIDDLTFEQLAGEEGVQDPTEAAGSSS